MPHVLVGAFVRGGHVVTAVHDELDGGLDLIGTQLPVITLYQGTQPAVTKV